MELIKSFERITLGHMETEANKVVFSILLLCGTLVAIKLIGLPLAPTVLKRLQCSFGDRASSKNCYAAWT